MTSDAALKSDRRRLRCTGFLLAVIATGARPREPLGLALRGCPPDQAADPGLRQAPAGELLRSKVQADPAQPGMAAAPGCGEGCDGAGFFAAPMPSITTDGRSHLVCGGSTAVAAKGVPPVHRTAAGA